MARNYNDVIKCIPIYKAAIDDDWETAKRIFDEEKKNFDTPITYRWNETALHIAVGTNSSHRFVEQLVEQIMQTNPQMLLTCNSSGSTPLLIAAKVGNMQCTRLLVESNKEMCQMHNNCGENPLEAAANHGRRDTLLYLLHNTSDVVGEDGTSPFRGSHGADLLSFCIMSDFYGRSVGYLTWYQKLN